MKIGTLPRCAARTDTVTSYLNWDRLPPLLKRDRTAWVDSPSPSHSKRESQWNDAQLRISEPFPITVSGVDTKGQLFQVNCVLENISSTGVYLKLPRRVKEGSEVAMSLKLSSAASSGARAALRGIVLRSDPQADESWGLAVAISECAFI